MRWRESDCLKIAVINDIHYDPYYDPNVDYSKFCRASEPFATDARNLATSVSEAKYGRMGCDPNKNLIGKMIKELQRGKDVDVLIINGDIVGHNIASKIQFSDELTETQIDEVNERYEVSKNILSKVGSIFI